jgi:hypothetical protein
LRGHPAGLTPATIQIQHPTSKIQHRTSNIEHPKSNIGSGVRSLVPAKLSRRQFSAALLPAVLAAGCGTILYPERRGQPPGQLDWGVVALNGIGLLFFFVPGVIAFAVDFITGAIYLPAEGYGAANTGGPSQLHRIDVPREHLTRKGIARIVSEAAGRPVAIAPDTCRTRPLKRLVDFWETRDALVTETGGAEASATMRSQSRGR